MTSCLAPASRFAAAQRPASHGQRPEPAAVRQRHYPTPKDGGLFSIHHGGSGGVRGCLRISRCASERAIRARDLPTVLKLNIEQGGRRGRIRTTFHYAAQEVRLAARI